MKPTKQEVDRHLPTEETTHPDYTGISYVSHCYVLMSLRSYLREATVRLTHDFKEHSPLW